MHYALIENPVKNRGGPATVTGSDFLRATDFYREGKKFSAELEPGELPSYESLLVPARDGEGILSRAYIVAPESCLFVSLSPFCMQEGDFYFRDSGSISKDVE